MTAFDLNRQSYVAQRLKIFTLWALDRLLSIKARTNIITT